MYQRDPANLAELRGVDVCVCVTGGIAAYKMCAVVSTLAQARANVHVAMTTEATRFVTALSFEALSGRPVHLSAWESVDRSDPQHIRLARACRVVLVAPCSMDMLARLATGRADDIVSLLIAATDRTQTPVLLAPSMNATMWSQPATQRNVAQLTQDGFKMLEPAQGWQACRTEGAGRLPEPDDLVDAIAAAIRL
ncbi:MAG: hypothetical protein EXS10_02895 [Phycisphaerales bacterium]|nr:hypothetical protein [Phycisphaerales bacterium]